MAETVGRAGFRVTFAVCRRETASLLGQEAVAALWKGDFLGRWQHLIERLRAVEVMCVRGSCVRGVKREPEPLDGGTV